MIEVMNLLSGYVRIKVMGVSPKRFINLCANRNILLWKIEQKEDFYEMCISIKGFRMIRPIVKKTKTKVVLLERFGLPFFMTKIFKKKLFILGLLLTCFLCFYSTLFVWKISISGNITIESEALLKYFQNNHIIIGTKKSDVPIETLEEGLRKEFKQITWTSIKLEGITLIVDIKENEYIEQEDTNIIDEPCNILAGSEGIVDSIIVRKGVPKVKIGDSVTKDQLLVEGKVPIVGEDGSIKEYLYVKADADIGIMHELSKNFRIPFQYVLKSYTAKEQKGFYVSFGDNTLHFTPKVKFKESDTYKTKYPNKLLTTLGIPFSFGQIIYKEYEKITLEYTLSEVQILLEEKCNEFIHSLEEKGVQIIEKNGKIDSDNNGWIYSCNFIVVETMQTSNSIQMNE